MDARSFWRAFSHPYGGSNPGRGTIFFLRLARGERLELIFAEMNFSMGLLPVGCRRRRDMNFGFIPVLS
jgi:hypothetical protein